MNTYELWKEYKEPLYFFILKKVKDQDATNEIFQNSFLKIHENLHRLKDPEKVKAWMYQIVRNEIADFYKDEPKHTDNLIKDVQDQPESDPKPCCMDRFIDNLPVPYKEAIEMVYLEGKKQQEVATLLNISLANVKARIHRGKSLLKQSLSECCKFGFNNKGDLIGESDCGYCEGN